MIWESIMIINGFIIEEVLTGQVCSRINPEWHQYVPQQSLLLRLPDNKVDFKMGVITTTEQQMALFAGNCTGK